MKQGCNNKLNLVTLLQLLKVLHSRWSTNYCNSPIFLRSWGPLNLKCVKRSVSGLRTTACLTIPRSPCSAPARTQSWQLAGIPREGQSVRQSQRLLWVPRDCASACPPLSSALNNVQPSIMMSEWVPPAGQACRVPPGLLSLEWHLESPSCSRLAPAFIPVSRVTRRLSSHNGAAPSEVKVPF